MTNKLFDIKVSEWTDTRLAEYLRFRYELITKGYNGGGSLLSTNKAVGRLPLLSSSNHWYSELRVFSVIHAELGKEDPAKLIHPNPFKLSDIRVGHKPCFNIWDQALALNDPFADASSYSRPSDVAPLRKINEHWTETINGAVSKAGPFGGRIRRPVGPYIYDLLRSDEDIAWDTLNLAMVKLMLSVDSFVDGSFGILAKAYKSVVASIVVSSLYGLPVRIGGKSARNYIGYKASVVTCDGHENASMLLPALSEESPRPDRDIGYVLVSIYTQPHPSSLSSGVIQADKEDRWCGMPTSVYVAGWETVEYVARQRLYKPSYSNKVFYAVPAADLMPPATFWAYLAMGTRARDRDGTLLLPQHMEEVEKSKAKLAEYEDLLSGFKNDPNYDAIRNRVWSVATEEGLTLYRKDLEGTDYYAWALGTTPPLPYAPCLSINRNSDGAPKRPLGFMPKNAREIKGTEWEDWVAKTKTFTEIVEKSAKLYEGSRKGYSASSRARRLRSKRWNKLNKQRKLNDRLKKIQAKMLIGRRTTKTDRRFLSEQEDRINHENSLIRKLPDKFKIREM